MTLISLLHDVRPTSGQKLAMRAMLRSLLGEMEFDRLSREVNFGTVDEGVLLIFVGAENCAAEIKLHHLDDFAVAAEFALGQPIRTVNVLVSKSVPTFGASHGAVRARTSSGLISSS